MTSTPYIAATVVMSKKSRPEKAARFHDDLTGTATLVTAWRTRRDDVQRTRIDLTVETGTPTLVVPVEYGMIQCGPVQYAPADAAVRALALLRLVHIKLCEGRGAATVGNGQRYLWEELMKIEPAIVETLSNGDSEVICALRQTASA